MDFRNLEADIGIAIVLVDRSIFGELVEASGKRSCPVTIGT